MAHSLQKLNHVHLSIAEMVLEGHDASTIARSCGRSIVGINMILSDAKFQEYVATRRSERNKHVDVVATANRYNEAQQVLDEALVDAARMQVNLMFSENENTAQKAIDNIFKETWGKKQSNVSQQVVINMEAGQNLNLHVALEEAFRGRSAPQIHHVESIESSSNGDVQVLEQENSSLLTSPPDLSRVGI